MSTKNKLLVFYWSVVLIVFLSCQSLPINEKANLGDYRISYIEGKGNSDIDSGDYGDIAVLNILTKKKS